MSSTTFAAIVGGLALGISLSASAYAVRTYLDVKSVAVARVETLKRDAIADAYRTGAFWQLACEHPDLERHSKDTQPCIEHRLKTGKRD